jgi:hypothetical protein
MDTRKECAERMRPILRAMEQSIDAARRQRTQGNSQATPRGMTRNAPSPTSNPTPTPTPAPACGPLRPAGPAAPGESSDAGRLKARPKRYDGTSPYAAFDSMTYRSKAS